MARKKKTHLPFRRRERAMQRFGRMKTLQKGAGRLTPPDRKPPSPIPNQAATVASTQA